MSITSAMNSAASGLVAVGRATELVSENIANALTPGYARRSLTLSSLATTGPGVTVLGVERHVDPVVLANRRVADARYAAAETGTAFFQRMSDLIGLPSDAGSISARMADFQASLISAASRPDATERLNSVVLQANGLAQSLNQASDGLGDMRTNADRSIGLMVDQLNTALQQVQDLNVRITATQSSGGSSASLLDQRQSLVDDINRLVPVTVVPRANDQIALYTEGGAILLDGPAATVGFEAATTTAPHMTVENGLLSGLTINGVPVRTDSTNGALRGGALGAQFAIRDEQAPAMQADLDAIARDLIERFETPGLDPTNPVGAPGLFTDNGGALDPSDETGLAGRLELNALVDPAQGGESWRLRDGLGATTPGPVGDASLLQAFSDILDTTRVPASGDFGASAQTATTLSASLMSAIGLDLSNSQGNLGFASASLTELSRMELAMGVDTDAELQSLLVLEQAYAANARVIEAVDEMMNAILRI